MACQISFVTTMFDVSEETPNPFNPIAGQSVLNWLRESMAAGGFACTEPEAEDWGWYLTVVDGDTSYMVGASSELDDDDPERSWSLQIERNRTVLDRILGRGKMLNDDSLSALIERLVRGEPEFRQVEVDRSA